MPTLFAPPTVAPVTLSGPPVLESWDAAGHPSQQRLRAYLDSVAELVGPAAAEGGTRLAMALDVGLADHVSLTRGGHDLDNYLFPLVRRFGAGRFDAVFARKRHAPSSTITVGPAAPPPDSHRAAVPPLLSVRTSVSATSVAWKGAIHAACRAACPEPAADGPLAVELCFRVSGGRNWSTLWKPAIDALGPLLGMPDPHRPFRPCDDRVVDLALHRNLDDSLGHDIVIDAWCTPSHHSEQLPRDIG
ncbi:hypothetical protein IM697_27115 [Streptomyces ferrugineus]|uniref:Uncharacterized protein n=1 Tax=Streptomyces ferrugineus TaxID=1413221 RepID=A0A7M2SC24_9ACTN|nr:hypothetical protein [Streptomyces ferrugineus]QOV33852.1 hypothetical protein IM697_27115 [Streptomyces ferrugineus]